MHPLIIITLLYEHRSSTQRNNTEVVERFNDYIKNCLTTQNPCCEDTLSKKAIYIIVICNNYLRLYFQERSKYFRTHVSLKSFVISFDTTNDVVISKIIKIIRKRRDFRNVFVVYKVCSENFFTNTPLDDKFIINNEELCMFNAKLKQEVNENRFYYEDNIHYNKYDPAVSWVRNNHKRNYLQDFVYYHKMFDNGRYFKFEVELKNIDISEIMKEYFYSFFGRHGSFRKKEIKFIKKHLLTYNLLVLQFEPLLETIRKILEISAQDTILNEKKYPKSFSNALDEYDISFDEYMELYDKFDDLIYFIAIFYLIKESTYFKSLLHSILDDVQSCRNRILVEIFLDLEYINSGLFTFYTEVANIFPYPVLTKINEYLVEDILKNLRSNHMLNHQQQHNFKHILTFFYIAVSKRSKIDLGGIVKAFKEIFMNISDFIRTKREILIRLEVLLHFTLSCGKEKKLNQEIKEMFLNSTNDPYLKHLIENGAPSNIMSVKELIEAFYENYPDEVETQCCAFKMFF